MGWLKKKEPRPVGLKLLKVAPDADDGAKFKALAALAETAQDKNKALEYSVQEKRARRFWHDKPLGGITGTAKFWFGLLHDAGSNYGRSIMRPLKIWLVSIFAFAAYYLGRGDFRIIAGPGDYALPGWITGLPETVQSGISKFYQISADAPQFLCGDGGSRAIGQSISFSLQTSLFQAAPAGPLISPEISQCLYAARLSVASFETAIPMDVAYVASGQIALSLILIALFLHAIWLRVTG